MNKKDREQQKEKRHFWMILEGWISIAINLVLFTAKYAVGVATGSVAIMADAWHTLSDSLTSLIVLIGAKISNKSPDEDHPFGHGRAELIATMIIGVLLLIVGFNFLVESVNKLKDYQSTEFGHVAVYVFVFSTILKEAIAQFSIRMGKKYDARTLIADGWHHRSDAIASALILVGIFLGNFFWWVDGVLGICVALLIFYTTFDILKQSIGPLIGERPDESLLEKIHEVSRNTVGAKFDIHHVHLHRYGQNQEVTFHLQFQDAITFQAAHECVSHLEKELRETLDIEATIHYEPSEAAPLPNVSDTAGS